MQILSATVNQYAHRVIAFYFLFISCNIFFMGLQLMWILIASSSFIWACDVYFCMCLFVYAWKLDQRSSLRFAMYFYTYLLVYFYIHRLVLVFPLIKIILIETKQSLNKNTFCEFLCEALCYYFSFIHIFIFYGSQMME